MNGSNAAHTQDQRTYVFQGREVTMPVEVRDATSGAVTYLVSAAAARKLLPGPELDVVEIFPGQALFSIAMIDYRDNDLGDYNEVSLAFFVRRKGETPAFGVPFLGSVVDFFRNSLASDLVFTALFALAMEYIAQRRGEPSLLGSRAHSPE